jgi:sugar/nucleoside kinase (ribokinase family)
MHITAVGDVMLDVIVDVPGGMSADDDAEATITLSAGGQAANVAAWAVALGASATVIGPQGDSEAAALVAERMRKSGVAFAAIPIEGGGTVVSFLSAGTRSMASDAGDQSWLSRVEPSDLPEDADWLHLSAYPLLRASSASAVSRLCFEARTQGTRISVDLASARLISAYGPAAFASLVSDLRPDVIFANQAEWNALERRLDETRSEIVLKQGRQGAVVLAGGTASEYPSPATEIVDATGAGDAFAAGYLVAGIDLALQTAALCISRRGAQPARTA